jgi:hypothetical protein
MSRPHVRKAIPTGPFCRTAGESLRYFQWKLSALRSASKPPYRSKTIHFSRIPGIIEKK